jgi:predicted membrane chloride channel (bestrophin family)
LGFVVALALSFRSSTAYERYAEGRKLYFTLAISDCRYWAQMVLTTRNLARLVWIHGKEREGDLGKEDLLGKLYSRETSQFNRQYLYQYDPWIRHCNKIPSSS